MILSLGWKNIWRNKTRSLVVIIAVMLGIFGGVMASGIMQGWIEQRIHTSIYNEIAHVQIHDSAYMENEELKNIIKDYNQVEGVLDTMKGVTAWSPRVKLMTMAEIPTNGAIGGLILRGVDPEKEKKVCEIYRNIVAGDFLEERPGVPSIVLGSKAAETFKLVNYQITPSKLKAINPDDFPDEVIGKVEKGTQDNFENKRDFEKELRHILSKDEYDEYATKLMKYFAYYELGKKMYISLPSKGDNELISGNFAVKVNGIYDTDNDMWDGMNAYVDRQAMNKITGLTDTEVHEIGIITPDRETGVNVAKNLGKYLPGYHIMSWREASPEIAMYTDFSAVMAYIYVAIILLALAFGIINTMMMAVLERIKELGMLMAIGMNKKRVFGMIMTESVLLTLTGAIFGMVFSGIILGILGRTGLNFEMFSEGFEAMGYASLIYPKVSVLDYLITTLLVIITAVISAIWPARKALKLNPVEALRTE
ncbi:MAG: ABC transporter permease [Bacteroidales bacterium]|nr:ABC transporter permease [Bacteroidales bacterium]